MTDRLTEMLGLQREFQHKLYGCDVADLMPDERAEYVRTMVLSCTAELFEALDETGWKPWATSRHLNRDAYLSELIDAWHFFMNLLLVADITPEEFMVAYRKKIKRNHERQEEGYDGVTEKCPSCKRSYDDSGVHCHPEVQPTPTQVHVPAYCSRDKAYI